MSYKLYLKEHLDTGLKYLGVTVQKDPHKYTGSGKHWKAHIAKHGYNVSTDVIFETEDYEVFKEWCVHVSDHLNIVESEEYANLIPETGDKVNPIGQKVATEKVTGSVWITNGKENQRVHLGYNVLPEGYWRGKTNKNPYTSRKKSDNHPTYYINDIEMRYNEAVEKYGSRFKKTLKRMKQKGKLVHTSRKWRDYETMKVEILS
jgi:hypothetical protein